MYNVTLKRFLATIVAVEKQLVLHTLECVFVALGIQAMFMSHTVICDLACLALQYFFHIIS